MTHRKYGINTDPVKVHKTVHELSAPTSIEAKRSASVLALLSDLTARAERGDILSLVVAFETVSEPQWHHEIVDRSDGISWAVIAELELAKINVMIKMGRLLPPGVR